MTTKNTTKTVVSASRAVANAAEPTSTPKLAAVPAVLAPELFGKAAKRTAEQDAQLAGVFERYVAASKAHSDKRRASRAASRINSEAGWVSGEAFWTSAELIALAKRAS